MTDPKKIEEFESPRKKPTERNRSETANSGHPEEELATIIRSSIRAKLLKEGNPQVHAVEKQIGKPIVIIYRENDLYRNNIPALMKQLETVSESVELISFPAGTEEKKIKKWLEINKASLEGKQVLTDRTIAKASAGLFKVNNKGTNLDEIFDDATVQCIFEDDSTSALDLYDSDSDKRLIQALKTLFKNVLRDPSRHPEKITILTNYIFDHGDFDIPEVKEARRTRKPSADNPQTRRIAGELIKKLLIEAGFPEDKILIEEELTPDNEADINQKNYWIINDRHGLRSNLDNDKETKKVLYQYKGNPRQKFEYEKNAAAFELPVSSFYHSASNEGLLSVTPERFQNQIAKIIASHYGNKGKKE